MLIALFASDKTFERYAELMADGGELPVVLFFIVVMFAAIPVTIAVRMFKKAVA